MAKIKLTKSAVDAAQPQAQAVELRDTVVPGFLCKITPAGRRVFMLQYRTNAGERRKPALGLFGELTVEQARVMAQDWLAEVRRGGDPGGAKTEARKAPTIAELCKKFMEDYSKKRNKPSTQEGYQGVIDRCIIPLLGRKKVLDVKRPDIAGLMEKLSYKPTEANKAFGVLRKMFNLAEVQVRNGRDGYRWDGEAWFGGDINRLTVKSEGEGAFREGVEGAEVQALYSRAIGPYFNLQAGVRHDFKPSPTRTYATLGFEGLAPYWFEIEGAAFVSDKGDVLGRLEGYYDQRVTQRLVLQPRVELNLSAQDMRAERIGSGLTDAEVGLRLRYEIRREFAPYVGVSWERKFGDTARFARADGEGTGGFAFVSGIRVWF